VQFLKERTGRWAVPVALSATLIAGLLISPVIAGPSGVTSQKVNSTIQKKTNATQLVVPTVIGIGAGPTTIASLDLGPGSYLVRTTFTARRDTPGANVSCTLRLVGVAQDDSTSFNPASTAEETVAMEVAGRAGSSTKAQLSCSTTGVAVANHVEITALKVPKVRVLTG
jgi:hypothetical protein